MSIFSADTDIDLVTRRDPKQIRARRFARVRKGYDPDQVRDFLDEVATWMEQIESDLLSAHDEAEAISRRPGPDPYAQMGSQMAELMRGAEEHAARVRREADEESTKQLAGAKQGAEEIRAEAQGQAKRIRTEAQEDAERLRREAHEEGTQLRAEAHAAVERARAEAEATLAGLTGERDRLLAEIRGARHRLAAVLTRLDEVLEDGREIPSPKQESAIDAPDEVEGPDGSEEASGPVSGAGEAPPPPAEASAPQPMTSLFGLDPKDNGPEDPFEWPELPPDPWEFTAELDRQLFGGPEGSERPEAGSAPRAASLFEDEAEFDPKDIGIDLPDIPLIEDHSNNDTGGPGS
jgi:DivIVA domain-containing protein